MNNDMMGTSYRQNGVMDFEKGDVVNRTLANRNFRSSMSQYLNKDNMEIDLQALMSITKELENINDKSKKRLDLIKEQKGLQDALARELGKEANDEKRILELNEKIQKSKIKAMKEYLHSSEKEREIAEASLKTTQKMLEVQEKLSKVTWADNLSKGLKEFSKDVSTISQALSLDKIVKGNREVFSQLRQSSMTSLGLTSNQFNVFKNDLIKQVQQMNTNIGSSLYGIEDVTNYMANLNNLGIHSASLAEQQVEAAIVGNKILGMSVETQANFIRVMKRTDNKELLQKQNETIANLLQSNLKISREQLDIVSANTATLLDQMASMGYSNSTLSYLGTTNTAAQAMVISGYGLPAGEALNEILQQYSSGDTYGVGSRLGSSYEAFADAMNSGNAGDALAAIMQSDRLNKFAQMDPNILRQVAYQEGLSAGDLQLIQMIRDGGKKLNWQEYNNVQGMTDEESKKHLQEIQESLGKGLTFQEKMENFIGLKLWSLPWEAHMSLADMAYWTFLASKTIELFKSFSDPGSIFHKGAFGKLSDAISGLSTHTTTIGTVLKAAAPVIGGIAAILGSIFMGIYDMKKAVDTGLNPIRAFFCGSGTSLWNVLWNAIKYLLIGVGVVLLAGISGLPALIITGVLAAIGAIAGFFGYKKNKQEKSAVSGGVGGTAEYGIGGADVPSASTSIKPWRISSKYGKRKPIEYKPGKWTSNFHAGIDLTRKSGTPIGANYAGYVVAGGSGWNGGRGNYIAIQDSKGFKHSYFHLLKPPTLKKGDYVNAGQIVGYMGSTGISTGTHLHYQINKGSKTYDPAPYLTSNLVKATATGVVVPTSTTGVKTTAKTQEKENLLGSLITEDTKQKDSVAQLYSNYFATDAGVGGPDEGGISGTVKTGFGDLINKLDELAAKQDDQERILAALTSKNMSSLYKY